MTLLRALALGTALMVAQEPQERPVEFSCPMDLDVRSKGPGRCPRCGMKLEAGIPEPVEYPIEARVVPRAIIPGAKARLEFQVRNPKTGAPVRQFEVVHERLFHLFIVSHDLEFFAHEHPAMDAQGIFRHDQVFPKPGHYRMLADFYPSGGTPQLATKSVFTKESTSVGRANLVPDLAPKQGENLIATLVTEPAQPLAGMKTMLFFRLAGADGLEPYLGALGHILAVSDDLIDMIHLHPAFPDAVQKDSDKQIQFNVIFPRETTYRLWVQFQNDGIVNTLVFTVAVAGLK